MRPTVDLLSELMACRPVTADVECVNSAVEVVRRHLGDAGLQTCVEDLDGRGVLYASAVPGKTPRVLLNAHLDVVPADEEMFRLREEGGRFAGRGTHDCLGNSAIAAQALIRTKGLASAGVVFSTDEETGGETTEAMVRRGYGAADLVLVLDGAGYAITTAQKGVLTVSMKASGTACHGAEPWKGENAIDKLVDGYARVRELFPPVRPADEWRNTMIAATIGAGTVHNRVPDEAEMVLNIRYTETTTADELLERLKQASGLTVEARMACPPVFFSDETPAFARLAECMRQTLGRDIDLIRMNGATDARHFAEIGVPVAIIGAPGEDPHGAGECVEADGLAAYEDMLTAFLAQYPAAAG